MGIISKIVASWPADWRDCLLLAGFSALIYGIAQLSAPGAWIAAGVLLLAGWVAPLVPRKKGS